jgi:thioredoxin 1
MENTNTTLPIKITEETFEQEVLRSDKPVLVDFWANWCPPCVAMNPMIHELAREYDGQAKIAKVDIEAYPALAQKFDIRSIPTLLVFKNGQVVSKTVGAVAKTILQARLMEQIAA